MGCGGGVKNVQKGSDGTLERGSALQTNQPEPKTKELHPHGRKRTQGVFPPDGRVRAVLKKAVRLKDGETLKDGGKKERSTGISVMGAENGQRYELIRLGRASKRVD